MSKLRRLTFCAALTAIAFTAAQDASAYTYKVIHDFCSKRGCKDGSNPEAALIMDSAGNLYGTTYGGGVIGSGVVFELAPKGRGKWTSKTLHEFCYFCDTDGMEPRAPLIIDTMGNLYGTTFQGGPKLAGTVFELLPDGSRSKRILKTLYSFSPYDQNGSYPLAGLTYQGAATGLPYDGTSPLFGTTFWVGTSGYGLAYELTLSGANWQETVIHTFCSPQSCADGGNPFTAGLIPDADGNLYGTTTVGGANSHGTAFQLVNDAGVWSETVLHDFCAEKRCTDGYSSEAALLRDASGNLYGTGSGSGKHKGNGGTVFKITPNSEQSQYSVVYNFCSERKCEDGIGPSSSGVIMDSAGTLYGTTINGGSGFYDDNHNGGGTIFALTGSTQQVLYQFCTQAGCPDGEYPMAGLVMDANGNLFGTTSEGGKYGSGVAFELSP